MKILMPQLGETVTEGTVLTWYCREGDHVVADKALFEIETEKVTMDVPAPAAGVLRRILVASGRTVAVGTPLAEFEAIGESPAVAGDREAVDTTASARPVTGVKGWRDPGPRRDARGRPLSPAVRRLVTERGVDIAALQGSGRQGRVRRSDVLASLAGGTEIRSEGSRLVPFNRLRKRTAEHMVLSKSTSPHVLQAVEADFSGVIAARDSAKDAWRHRHGFSLTLLPFVAHAVSRTLGEFPLINSSVEGDALRVHADVNLAVAVDLSFDGLVAPVISRAHTLTVAELARRIHDLTQRARSGQLRPDDMKGGTYTISNSGSFGTLITAPIINQPQVAILSLDAVSKRPVVVSNAAGDAIAIRPVGVLAQSFDHRAMDGAYSAAYLRALRTRIESCEWSEEIAR